MATSLDSIYLPPGTSLISIGSGYVPYDVIIGNDLIVGAVAKTADTPTYPVGWIVVFDRESGRGMVINNIAYSLISESSVIFALAPLP